MTPTIRELVEAGLFRPVDAAFAAALGRLAGETDPLALLGAAAARAFSGRGHVCVDLAALGDHPIRGWEGEDLALGDWPSAAVWRERLRASALVSRDCEAAPLVLDGDLLYLHRIAETESRLARHLLTRTAPPSRLSVVTGGPGTGKTSALASDLARIVEGFVAAEGRAPRIALAAPTGKAAARMAAAVGAAKRGERKPELRCAKEIAAMIPDQASTLHRLLGFGPRGERRFLFDARHRLPFDVVAVDEASMVDLDLMTALLDAVPSSTRVILMGDKNQLASVQAGAVLADLCAGGAGAPWITELERSYRFGDSSALGGAARLLNAGRSRELLAALEAGRFGDEVRLERPADGRAALESIVRRGAEAFSDVLTERDPARRLEAMSRLGVLCAHRNGPLGSTHVNREIERRLAGEGRRDPGDPWYDGRPIIVLENSPRAGVFNGDVGVVSREAPGRDPSIFFAAADGGLRALRPGQLAAHETAFAITVHKSQGSEYDDVIVLLPLAPSPVTTRELLYTALTRARARATIVGTSDVLAAAVDTRTTRFSGLAGRPRG
ncbi:MAG: exodeoxyribonuclease V subunit alpha [Proteobacteria bacterium]|nr:exodeoxyribonuclease V subunit alpha [Pseudomonadota bacterium]